MGRSDIDFPMTAAEVHSAVYVRTLADAVGYVRLKLQQLTGRIEVDGAVGIADHLVAHRIVLDPDLGIDHRLVERRIERRPAIYRTAHLEGSSPPLRAASGSPH